MRRILVPAVLLAALASIIALLYLLSQDEPRPELPVVQRPPAVIPAPPEQKGATREKGTLRGKVVYGPTGEPLEGATVIALAPYLDPGDGDELPLWGEMMEKKRLVTGEDGTFRMEDMPPDYWNIWAEKAGYGFTTVPRAEFKREHVLTLWPGASITGRVLYPDRSPAEGVRIEYTPQGTHSEIFSRYRRTAYHMRTNREGRFTYRDLPPGKFTIEAYPDSHLPAPWAAEPPLKPGEERELKDHILDPGFGMVVNVRWRGSNEPVEGVEVVVRPVGDPMPRTKIGRRKRTDQNGVARFAGLGGQILDKPRFTVAAKIGGETVIPDEGGMIEPGSEVTIWARRACSISGRVVRANGAPLQRFFLELRAKGFHTSQLQEWVPKADNGKFTLRGIPEGDYRLFVRLPGLVDETVDVSAVAGEENDVGTIVLADGAEIWGVVSTASGKELPSIVRVVLAKKVTRGDGKQVFYEPVARVPVQSDGSYSMSGLPEGTFWIQPTVDGANLGTSEPEQIAIARSTDVIRKDITMHGEGFLDLHFYDMVDGARRRVLIPPTYAIRKSDGKETRWFSSGTPLRPGKYEIQVALKNEDNVSVRYTAAEVTVQEDETTDPIEVSLHEIRDAE